MRVEVAKHESLVMELKRQIQEKKEKLDAIKKRLERQQAVSKEDKVGISNRNKHHHLKILNFPFKMWIRFENIKYYIFYGSFRITCNFLRQSCFHEPSCMLICFSKYQWRNSIFYWVIEASCYHVQNQISCQLLLYKPLQNQLVYVYLCFFSTSLILFLTLNALSDGLIF